MAEFTFFLVLTEISVLLLLPTAFLFASADFEEVGELNINLRSPRGKALLAEGDCDFESRVAAARGFFNCSLRIDEVSIFWGGTPRVFVGSASGMSIYSKVFLKGPPGYCPRASLLVHEFFHAYQYSRGWWSPAVLADELYLQATQRWAMYEYGDLRDALSTQRSFRSFNPEQQASIVEDYFTQFEHGYNSSAHAYFVLPLLKDCPAPHFA
jgi:hypothetical protein